MKHGDKLWLKITNPTKREIAATFDCYVDRCGLCLVRYEKPDGTPGFLNEAHTSQMRPRDAVED